MRTLILILFPFVCFGQFGFYTANPEPASSQKGLNSNIESYGADYFSADSVSKIDLTSAFSVELWQFIGFDAENRELIRIYSQDTVANYFYMSLSADIYLKVGFVNGASVMTIDTENEVDTSPKSISGKIDVKDWYHIVYTFDGSSSHKMYVNGIEATFSNSGGAFQDVHGDYVVKHNSLFRSGPFRFFGKELSSANVTTLWNEGTPLLTTSITDLKLEYTHQGNTWDGSKWIIDDTADSPVDAEGNGFTQSELVNITDFEPNQSFDLLLEDGKLAVIDNYLGYSEFNFDNSGSRIGPFASGSIGPYVWYDTSTQKTVISAMDRVGLGANMEGAVYVFDHATNLLKKRVKTGNNVTNGIVDTHPGIAVISYNGTIATNQERQHNSPIYFTSGSLIDSRLSLDTLDSFSANRAYPCLQVVDTIIYSYSRDTPSDIKLSKSTDNGASWTGNKNVGTLSGVDAFYPAPFYHPSRLAFFANRRAGGPAGTFSEVFFIQSDDGLSFYNADSTFTDTDLSDSELVTNFRVDTISTQSRVDITVAQYGNDTIVAWRDTVFYAADKGSFQGKSSPISNVQALIYVSPGTWDMVAVQSGKVNIYRTTDFFDTATLHAQVNTEWDADRIKVPQNTAQVDEILISCVITGKNGTKLTGNNLRLGFFLYDKTQ